MTVREIAQQVSLIIGQPINENYTSKIINDCITVLSVYDTFNIINAVEFSTNEGKELELPSNTISIVKVLKSDDIRNPIFKDYEVYNNRMFFKGEGDFKIITRNMPTNVKEGTDVLTMHPAYQQIMADYVASIVLQRENPNDPKGTVLQEQFMSKAQGVHDMLSHTNHRNKQMPKRIWR